MHHGLDRLEVFSPSDLVNPRYTYCTITQRFSEAPGDLTAMQMVVADRLDWWKVMFHVPV
jgi:hypothetical protein